VSAARHGHCLVGCVNATLAACGGHYDAQTAGPGPGQRKAQVPLLLWSCACKGWPLETEAIEHALALLDHAEPPTVAQFLRLVQHHVGVDVRIPRRVWREAPHATIEAWRSRASCTRG
jgi:hypothetical protein